jgi:hypothetical protein
LSMGRGISDDFLLNLAPLGAEVIFQQQCQEIITVMSGSLV